MSIPVPRGPIVVVGIAAYGLVSLSIPMGVLLKPALGEAADLVAMVGFLWPYPLLLSLQGLLPAEGAGAWLVFGVIVLLGLGVVWFSTSYVQRRLGHDKWTDPRAYVWAPWLWFLPLLALQAAAYGLALLGGLPVGE